MTEFLESGPGLVNRYNPMAHPEPEPFYLIVTDFDRGVFAVEGAMTDTSPWDDAATFLRSHHRDIRIGPTGANRDKLCGGTSGGASDARWRAARQRYPATPGVKPVRGDV